MTGHTLPIPSPANGLSITTALALSPDHNYRPPAVPSEQDSVPLTLAAEITYHGLPQRMEKAFVAQTAEWAQVKECLERSREGSWQTRMLELERAEGEGERVGRGGEEGWLYQEVVQGVPRKDFHSLKTAKRWRKLRARIVGEPGVGVVIWPEILHAEMLQRRAWLQEAEAEELVDFHNACDMDVSSLPAFQSVGKDDGTNPHTERPEPGASSDCTAGRNKE